MEGSELWTILAWVLFWAVLIGAATWMLLRLLRRASVLAQICLVVVATVAVLVAGMVSAFNAMFISARDLEVMWYILATASAVAVALSLMLGAGVSRNAAHLVDAARRLGRGETLEHTVGEGRGSAPAMTSELAELAQELEASSRSLAESRRREAAIETARRELVSWISHDLRTPLASMRAMTEALEDGMASDVQGYYRKIIGQTEQMTAMVNDLLELSKIQAGTLRLRAEPLDLYDLVSDAISDLAPLAAQRGIRLDGGGDRECMAVADGPSLARAVRNIVLNAILYSAPDSEVHISVGRGIEGNAVIAVEDHCGGLPEEDLPYLFETGWQKDPARRTTEALHGSYSGAGIGLSMVAGIVKAHGGSVTVHNIDGGCRFALSLPAGEAPPEQLTAGTPSTAHAEQTLTSDHRLGGTS
ncbi:sensor histidine kinase KdpD [Paenarthrobacter aurescens]|uniref:histidine kinase n=1 Tax=Paenarthrobacter aurescens TaxID=43663 RepID=A0A4Y3NL99_PAEAU|nr:HAMP domain-containing sensor histidine kinase [Paenarthrobacter aurescens]MDO6143090.1 HAMP domain-containing histidine kinase [Paenarthrobacter aurescens]MDO6146935.1 HAMP domain-containing histidine kinase [Paenarthrobacter aurescens]MDO6158181.1 HAMP domain-containing histidine kinase [Paenarthrobacter aurescens]MDO6162166.1 HAMP domain-containing histidine kinase [Paenarthrobacter aurescens]GEB19751.1 two-component sensor histidine kinase [Paenarthrobacter aurescens]